MTLTKKTLAAPSIIGGLLFALAACGSSASNESATPQVTTGTTADAGAAATTADAGPPAVPGLELDGDTLTLTMGPFTVPPGAEVYKCQDFVNPFGGVDQDADRYEVHMTAGSHHSFLFFLEPNDPLLFGQTVTNSPISNCALGGNEYHPYPISTQSPDGVITYPAGVGSRIPGNTGLRMNAHYINPGADPITATVTMIVHKATPGTISQYAGTIFLNQANLTIPPGTHDATATMTLGSDIKLLLAASHMHQRATNFVATTNTGTQIYQTTQWDEPVPTVFTDPMPIAQGTQITWTCTYDNETTGTLVFGELASKNVMCIFSGQYYPVADPTSPTITAQ